MKTLLIPIDFTETSLNAVAYAAGFCKQFEYDRVILLKSFYDTLFDEVVMSAEFGGVGNDFRVKEHEEAEERLQEISKDLSLKNKELEVLALTSELPLMRAIAEVINDENPRAILLGSDTNAYDNDSYVGGHVIQIARTSPINVIIVPAGSTYQTIRNIVVPVDTFSKASLARINELGARPLLQSMHLNILKIDAEHSGKNNEESVEGEELHRLLGTIPHEVFFSHEKKTIDAIMNFLKQHPAEWIIALPGKYSFLYRLTH